MIINSIIDLKPFFLLTYNKNTIILYILFLLLKLFETKKLKKNKTNPAGTRTQNPQNRNLMLFH